LQVFVKKKEREKRKRKKEKREISPLGGRFFFKLPILPRIAQDLTFIEPVAEVSLRANEVSEAI